MINIENEIEAILKTLTLKEKVTLLSGKDHWGTVPFESKGIKQVIVTDGPHGVRIGNEDSDREKEGTATAFPTGVAMASTWDVKLIKKVAIALAEETTANRCDVLLGPCINIVRTPVGNRNFETYSEDPFLAGKIGISYIDGLQSRGIGASLKHFAANNQEFERTRGSSNMDERTLREIYLSAFEMIVKESNPWTIMCSYNRLNGEHTSQNYHLLTEILKNEWGFTGIVISDWGANHTMFESIKAGLDLEMPGPPLYYGKYLEEAVKTWHLDQSYIDEAARRIIRLSKRVEKYKLENPDDKGAFSNAEHIELARETAATSAVLLKNTDSILPIKRGSRKKIAVIGPCAKEASYGGGGSSIVNSEYTVSPLDGIRNYYGDDAEITFTQGCKDRAGSDDLPNVGINITSDGSTGFLEEYFDNRTFCGEPLSTSLIPSVDFWNLFAPNGIDRSNFSVKWSGDMEVEKTGEYKFYLSYQGNYSLNINGEVISEDMDWQDVDPYPFYTIKKVVVKLKKGIKYSFCLDFINTLNNERQAFILKADYLFTEKEITTSINSAVELAKTSDLTLLFAGHATGYEVEGKDRKSLKLPGEQNRLIEEICNADPYTVLVLNTGAPIEMPWIDKPKAVIQAHFFGQEGGNAIADVLHGNVNPSGKLTTSYPLRNQDNPAYIYYPGEREHNYGEGVFVGYRYYDFKEMDVLFPFGFGLSYTDFEYSDLKITGSLENKNLQAEFCVENIGRVQGAEVVQLYVSDLKCSIPRPIKELKGFDKVLLKPGEKQSIIIDLNHRSFSYWDNYNNNWKMDPGYFVILVGSSSRDIRLKHDIKL